jgi:hypothetical protein
LFYELETRAWRYFQTRALGLVIQWERTDYKKKNFIGADLEDEKFRRLECRIHSYGHRH